MRVRYAGFSTDVGAFSTQGLVQEWLYFAFLKILQQSATPSVKCDQSSCPKNSGGMKPLVVKISQYIRKTTENDLIWYYLKIRLKKQISEIQLVSILINICRRINIHKLRLNKSVINIPKVCVCVCTISPTHRHSPKWSNDHRDHCCLRYPSLSLSVLVCVCAWDLSALIYWDFQMQT